MSTNGEIDDEKSMVNKGDGGNGIYDGFHDKNAYGSAASNTELPPTPVNEFQSLGNWSTSQADGEKMTDEDVTTEPGEPFGYAAAGDPNATQDGPGSYAPIPPMPQVTQGMRDTMDNPVVYMPQGNPAGDNKPAGRGHSGHLSWLLGGIAAGALIVGLGFATVNSLNGHTSVPGHMTTHEVDVGGDAPKSISISADGTESLTLASAVAEKCLPSVVAIHVSDGSSVGMGSGVVIDNDGHVLTNSHVVKDMSEIVVVSGNGEEYEASLLGLDDSSDLAVLNVDWGDAKVVPMEYGDSGSLKVGEWVMTLGSPYGLDQSVSTGIVSALSRNQMMESYDGYRIYANLIQTDAAINLGNSGGALVNAEGELVGINSMLASNSGSYSAVGFAIPSNYAKRVADQIIEGKDVEHAYIGAQFGNVSRLSMSQQESDHGIVVDETGNEVDQSGDSPTTGAYVAGVMDDSPAKEAGLKEGDIITKFGDEHINSASGIILAIRAHEIGETVPMTVWRDDKEITLEVTLGSDAGKGLYDNNGTPKQQQHQQPSPYDGYEEDLEYLRRMFEEFGITE